MPPPLSARTCWRAGWVVLGLGITMIVVSSSVASVLFDGQGPDALAETLYTVLSVVSYVAPSAGVVLLVGSVVVRHVERLTDALVASETIGAVPAPTGAERGQRRVDGAVDLDDLRGDLDDVVERGPGVR